MSEKVINTEAIEVLTQYANLPLDDARKQAILPILQAWVPAANALNERMSHDEVRGQLPGTIFTVSAKR